MEADSRAAEPRGGRGRLRGRQQVSQGWRLTPRAAELRGGRGGLRGWSEPEPIQPAAPETRGTRGLAAAQHPSSGDYSECSAVGGCMRGGGGGQGHTIVRKLGGSGKLTPAPLGSG